MLEPRRFLAPNPSPMTLDGTATWVVGHEEAAVIDPGPADPSHIESLAAALAGARTVRILLTHTHPDHAAGARDVARKLDARIFGLRAGTLRDGATLATDQGELVAIATPGHTPDHVSFHWPAAAAVFCGDLMMGGLDTSLVAAPEGDLGAYLASLERLRGLDCRTIYPAHGPAFTDAAAALDRYVDHRRRREDQVLDGIRHGARDLDALTDHVYGDNLPPELRDQARAALQAYITHLAATGRFPTDDD